MKVAPTRGPSTNDCAPGSATAGPPATVRIWRQLALVSALFCIFVSAGTGLQHLRSKTDDPFGSTQLAGLKEKLAATPSDDALKQQIRSLDLRLRERYFRAAYLTRTGAWLALGSAVIFFCAAHQVRRSLERLPAPTSTPAQPDQLRRNLRLARWSTAALAVLGLGAMAGLAFSARTALPINSQELQKLLASPHPKPAGDFASWADLQRNWPRFRGADGNGTSAATNLALSWDAGSGRGLAWKIEVPAPGFNSPIVWEQRLFISGGDAAKQEVFCFDTRQGQLLWRQPVPSAPPRPVKAPEIPEQTGYAASTMASDGRRVYAMFANGQLAAFSLGGQLAWSKSLGFPKNPHGHAASLVARDGRLFVQVDQGEPEQNASRLHAFDSVTGSTIWERPRPSASSWATPIVVEVAGKKQVITLGMPWVIAYSFDDGTELWRVEGLSNEVTSSPIFAGGLVLAISPNEKLFAIRPDGQGDVTKTHIAWAAEDNVPDITSPVSSGELVFTVSTPGMVTCYDLKDGKKQWEQDLALECQASPTLVGQHLYILAADGTGVVLEAGRTFKELSRNQLGERVFASPAIASNRIFLRGLKHLFCVGPSDAQSVHSQ